MFFLCYFPSSVSWLRCFLFSIVLDPHVEESNAVEQRRFSLGKTMGYNTFFFGKTVWYNISDIFPTICQRQKTSHSALEVRPPTTVECCQRRRCSAFLGPEGTKRMLSLLSLVLLTFFSGGQTNFKAFFDIFKIS